MALHLPIGPFKTQYILAYCANDINICHLNCFYTLSACSVAVVHCKTCHAQLLFSVYTICCVSAMCFTLIKLQFVFQCFLNLNFSMVKFCLVFSIVSSIRNWCYNIESRDYLR